MGKQIQFTKKDAYHTGKGKTGADQSYNHSSPSAENSQKSSCRITKEDEYPVSGSIQKDS